MVFFNWATMQMAAKIVYYGPGLCGKTSNLSYIYAKTTPNSRGEMVSLETESDRTLFFDLLPIEVGTIGGFKTRLQLYTVPGQVFYNTTRKLVLKGVDGLVFVADSQRPMREANIESFSSLIDNLEDLGLEMGDLPLVLQFNKRDLKNLLTPEELNSDLNDKGWYPHFKASAINGDGVFETLKEITKLTLKKLRKRMASSQPGGVSPASEPVRPAMSPQRPESISAAALARAAEEGVVSDAPSGPTPPSVTPVVPTTVAPPMPASDPPTTDSNVFATPTDPPDEEISGGPLDDFETPGPEIQEDEVELEFPGESEVEIEAAGEAEDQSESWQEKSTEVSELSGDGGAEAELELAEDVDFDQQITDDELPTEPPPMKRVHVSNQLDILAELEGLRVGSLSGGAPSERRPSTSEIDIDSLLSGAMGGTKEIRRRIKQQIDPEVFGQMKGLEVTIQVKDAVGDEIQVLEPMVLEVECAKEVKKLSVRFAIDLDSTD